MKTLYGRGNQSGNKLARQLQKENPGIYEKYEDLYQSGDYLLYTESLAQERALMDQLYEEISKVAEYETYLEEMEENAGQAGSISIFRSPTGEKTFSQRNLEKSAADHAGLYSANIRWFPSKGIVMAIKNPATDMFLILSVFLFVGAAHPGRERKRFVCPHPRDQAGPVSRYGCQNFCHITPLRDDVPAPLWFESAICRRHCGIGGLIFRSPVDSALHGKQSADFFRVCSSFLSF